MKTKEIFANSLYHLLEEHTFDDITVNDIIANSDKSRATFYRHFENKYQVLEYLFHYKLSPYLEYTNAYYDKDLNKEYMLYFKEHYDVMINILEDKQNTFIKLLYNKYIQILTRSMIKLNTDEMRVLYIYLHGTIMTAVSWQRKGVDLSIKERLRLFNLAMPEILRNKLKSN